jgi:hypothetical protein
VGRHRQDDDPLAAPRRFDRLLEAIAGNRPDTAAQADLSGAPL